MPNLHLVSIISSFVVWEIFVESISMGKKLGIRVIDLTIGKIRDTWVVGSTNDK